MRDRPLRPRACALALLALIALGGCSLPGRDAVPADAGTDSVPAQTAQADPGPTVAVDSGVPADSGQSADSLVADAAQQGPAQADSVATAVPPVESAVDATQQAPTPQFGTLEQQIAQLILGQQAIRQRLDSLDARTTGRTAATAAGSVVDQAGQSVQNFGLGVVSSVIVIIIFNLTIRGSVWLLDALSERNPTRRLFYKRMVPIVRIVLWIFAAYLIVRVIFRVDAQGFLAAAAAVGVAVGFAAQDLIKNLFGGLILVFDQPFQVGDKVSVGGTYGEVVSIGLRSTRLVTPDDNLVSVPNSQVVDQQVANANAGELNCQVVTDLYLPGWADEDAAKRIAFNAAASSKFVYLNKPIVVLVADQFKETFLTRVRVKAYVMDPRLEFMFQSDVTERARAGFREAGLLKPEHMRTYLVRHSSVRDVVEDDDREWEAGEVSHERA